MKNKPKALVAMSAFFIAIALGMPLQIMFLYGHSPFEVMAILTKIAPMNWMIMAVAPITALLVYHSQTASVIAVPVLSYLVVSNNWLVSELGTDYSSFTAGLGSVAFLSVTSLLLTERLREVLLHPESRWWLTPSRRKIELPVIIGHDGVEFLASTFDISETGAFLNIWPKMAKESSSGFSSFAPGKIFYLNLDLKNSQRIQCRAEVVRQTQAQGDYPSGIGIRFIDMDRAERKMLSDLTQDRRAGQVLEA